MPTDETTIVIKGDSKNAQNAVKSLNLSLESISSTAKKVAAASGVVFAGLTGIGALATKSFGNFQNSMLSVKTLLDENTFQKSGKTLAEGFEDMSKRTLKVFSDMPIALDAATTSMFNLVSAGVDAGEATDVLAKASKLAVAGVTSVDIAVDGLTSVMNAYGKSAKDANKISGKFFLAQKYGKTTIAELSSGFGKVAASANAANVSFEEVVSAVSAMTLGGIKTAESYTGLQAVIAGISIPTASATIEAERLGIQFNAAALRAQGLSGFLESLTKNTKFTKDSVTKLFGSMEAQKAIFALTANEAEKFSEILKNVNDDTLAVTTVNKAYEDQVSSFNNQLTIAQNKFKALSIEIGERLEPVFKKLVDTFSGIVNWFTQLDDGTKDLIVSIGIFVTAAAGIVTALAGFAAILPSIVTGLGMIRIAVAGIAAVMAANPIGLAIAAISTAVIALGIDWGKTFDKMGKEVETLTDKVQAEAAKQRSAYEKIDRFFKSITISGRKNLQQQDLKDITERDRARYLAYQKLKSDELELEKKSLDDKARAKAEADLKARAKALDDAKVNAELEAQVREEVERKAQGKTQEKAFSFDAALEEGAGILIDAGDAIASTFESFGNVVTGVFTGAFKDEIGGILTSLESFSMEGFGLSGDVFERLDSIVDHFVASFPKMVSSFVKAFPELIKKIVEAVPKLVKVIANSLPEITKVLMEAIPVIIEMIPEMVQSILDVVPEVLTNILQGMPAIIQTIFEAIPEIVRSFVDAIPVIVEVLAENMAPIIESLVVGLSEAAGEIVAALIESLLVEGGLERIVKALLASIPRIAAALVRGIGIGLEAAINAIGASMGRAFEIGFANILKWFRDFRIPVPEWMNDFLRTAKGLFDYPQWVEDFKEAVRKLTTWEVPGFGSGGFFSNPIPGLGEAAAAGLSTITGGLFAKGRSPDAKFLQAGMTPRRGMDYLPAVIDPRERLFSHSQNVDMIRTLNSINAAVSGGQKIQLVFSGDGIQEFIERALVSANALGTGRIDVGVGSEA